MFNSKSVSMKEKFLAALIAKFVGVDKAILERIAEKKAGSITEEGQIKTVVDGMNFGEILNSEADRRATEASQSAVSNYEKKHNLKDGQKVQQQSQQQSQQQQHSNPNEPDWFRTYREEREEKERELQAKIDGFESGKRAEGYKATVIAKLKEKKVPEKFIGEFTIESEDQIEEFVTKQESRYNEFKQEMINSGNYTEKPQGSSGSVGGSDSDIEAWAERKNSESQPEVQ